MNLPKALAALDALACHEATCYFGARDDSNCRCTCFAYYRSSMQIDQLHRALAAVVKAARESVAAGEREREELRAAAASARDLLSKVLGGGEVLRVDLMGTRNRLEGALGRPQ